MKILNISHANCTDGILASHALRSVLSSNIECDYVFMQYGSELPTDAMKFYDYVIITDFSFSRVQAPTIVDLLKNDVVVIVIDHHEGSKWIMEESWCPKDLLDKFVMIYSETESGALITHNLLTGEDLEPLLIFGDVEQLHLFADVAIDYATMYSNEKRALYESASDYDLFTKSTLRSSYLNEYVQFLIGSIGYSDVTEIFDTITAQFIESLYGYIVGESMYEAKMAMVKTVYSKPMATISAKEIFPAELITWKDPTVMIFNSPSAFTNEGCESVMDKCSFAMSWKMIEGNAISVSLRGSRARDIDLRPLAEHFGGSGHATACGFKVDVGSPMHTYLTTGVTPKMTATKKARDKYAMRQSCIGATYKARSEHQRKEWAAGRPYHNIVDDECTPDFNCCFSAESLT